VVGTAGSPYLPMHLGAVQETPLDLGWEEEAPSGHGDGSGCAEKMGQEVVIHEGWKLMVDAEVGIEEGRPEIVGNSHSVDRVVVVVVAVDGEEVVHLGTDSPTSNLADVEVAKEMGHGAYPCLGFSDG
jgi:hypothetical protein